MLVGILPFASRGWIRQCCTTLRLPRVEDCSRRRWEALTASASGGFLRDRDDLSGGAVPVGHLGDAVATVYPGATETPMMASSRAGADLGFNRRPAADVAADIVDALQARQLEINTTRGSDRIALQELNTRGPEAVDAELTPKLDRLRAARRSHRSI